MQILIPISGHSTFFPKEEYFFPKPLIEVAGKPMIEVVVNQLLSEFPEASFTFIIDKEDARNFSLDRTLKLLTGPLTTIIEKAGPTAGALCSCLLAIDHLSENEELIVANCDQIIETGLSQRIAYLSNSSCSSGVITFTSIHPRWSYVVEGDHGQVEQTFEKQVASQNAIAGIYYFRSADLFCNAAQQVILKNSHTDSQFYISSALNEVILSGDLVLHCTIDNTHYHSFYSPEKISEFELTTIARKLRVSDSASSVVNLIIPAAGQGSRFATAGWNKPKPFIDVDGQPMLERVIHNVAPINSNITVLLRQEHISEYPQVPIGLGHKGVKVIPVPSLTDGTASTVLLARKEFNNGNPLVIANSDQLVSFDPDEFVQDCLTRNLDGSILVFRDATQDPKWSFARVDEHGLVLEVAEKKPISTLATVGIYMFARGSDFIESALDMMIANDRVGNEFYTCPVYNYMIRRGASIGVYEISENSMAGLGTPDDLEKYLLTNNLPPSIDAPV